MKPKNALIRAPARDAPKVSLYEATTRGSVTVAQNDAHPMVAVLRKSADSGMSTSRLR